VSRLRTIAEAAEYLNVPYTWLRDKVTARQVPHTRLGRHVRFTEEHLTEIVLAGEQVPRRAERQHTSELLPTGRRRRTSTGRISS
jgi:excisionase family DNA binding protein